jgi:hypothetical protein
MDAAMVTSSSHADGPVRRLAPPRAAAVRDSRIRVSPGRRNIQGSFWTGIVVVVLIVVGIVFFVGRARG